VNPEVAKALGLPRLRQIGIVVKDLERTARYYRTTFGIGPWYRLRTAEVQDLVLRGEPIDPRFEIAIAYSGRIQLELIAPQGGNALYDEHLRTRGEGLHHLGFCVRNLGRRLEVARSLGLEVLQSGTIRSHGGAVTRFAYLDTCETGGIIIELIETRFAGLHVGMSRPIVALGRLMGNFERIAV
jgi:catechol 2,3-dioxygenase-like lactoylglutathione lyase family enzyme